jgi:hypothetical protein
MVTYSSLFLVRISRELNQNVAQHGLKLFVSIGSFGIEVLLNTNEYSGLAHHSSPVPHAAPA